MQACQNRSGPTSPCSKSERKMPFYLVLDDFGGRLGRAWRALSIVVRRASSPSIPPRAGRAT